MGNRIHTSQEIRNALLAASHTTLAALAVNRAQADEYGQGYQDGYQKALFTIALDFGLVALSGGEEQRSFPPCCPLSEQASWR